MILIKEVEYRNSKAAAGMKRTASQWSPWAVHQELREGNETMMSYTKLQLQLPNCKYRHLNLWLQGQNIYKEEHWLSQEIQKAQKDKSEDMPNQKRKVITENNKKSPKTQWKEIQLRTN